MSEEYKNKYHFIRILVLAVVVVTCAKFISDYLFYEKFQYYSWKSKAFVLFIASYAIYDLFKEIVKYMKQRNLQKEIRKT